ncbi:MAG TPA: nitroreductase [Hyphomicrobiaceae bacterium]|nr:nitroreductase [Hyphomicrobiaceae bacterium]
MNKAIVDFLLTRRSSKPALLTDPGPTAGQLETILTAASRVPDHKKLTPWRFIVFEGEARRKFGEHLAEICREEEHEPPSDIRLETERGRFMRAPAVICVIASARADAPVPVIEQTLSAGAACFNLCLAANALGFGSSWITEWYAFSPRVAGVLGLAPHEAVAGFVYLGTASETQPDRDRPALSSIVSRWQG